MRYPAFLMLWSIWVLLAFSLKGQSPIPVSEKRGELASLKGADRLTMLIEVGKALVSKRDTSGWNLLNEALGMVSEEPGSPDFIRTHLDVAEIHIEAHQYEDALFLLNTVKSFPSIRSGTRSHARMQNLFGKANNFQGNYDEAEPYFMACLDEMEELGDPAGVADAHGALANNFRYRGAYEKATSHRFKALAYYEEVQDSAQIIETFKGLGIIQLYQDEPHEAKQKFELMEDYYQRHRDTVGLGHVYNFFALTFYDFEEYEQAIAYSQRSLEYRQMLGDIRGQGESLNNMAISYMALEKWDEAFTCMQGSLAKLREGNDLRQIPVILLNVGWTKYKSGEKDEALAYYLEAERTARMNGVKNTLANVYNQLARHYYLEEDYKTAISYMGKSRSLRDSIFTEDKVRAIKEMEIRYQTQQKDMEIERLMHQQEAKRRERYGLIGGMILIAIIAFLIVRIQQLRNRRDLELHKREKTILQTRESLARSELQNTRNELEFNRNRLYTYMRNILDKNKLVEQLEKKLQTLELDSQSAEQSRKQKLNELLELKILTDEDWLVFKNHFQLVHRGFFERLDNEFPNLTRGEARLFVLLKLNLTSNEIANILGISPGSVKKGRYRLRKKLGLKEDENLQSFVSSFE